MLDCITEIPLPGRFLAPPATGSRASAVRKPLPSFVAGPENRLVAGTIANLMQSVSADNETRDQWIPSPLVLFGPHGTGKTHLALGLVQYWQAERGESTSLYTTAADFRHRLNDAIKRQAEVEFRAEFRGRQLLIVDDLQFLPADSFAFEELRYTLDDYEERGALVIITCSEPPALLRQLPADLADRLAGGLLLELAPPGAGARLQLIRQAAQALGRPLTDENAQRLAHGLTGPASVVFAAVADLAAGLPSKFADETRTEQILSARAPRRPTLREITAAVARYQNIPQSQLKSASRRQSVVFARGLIAYLARELASASYEDIGRALGGRDHTTVIHSYRKIAAANETDLQTRQAIERLRHILLGNGSAGNGLVPVQNTSTARRQPR